ncbi:MAG: hypothetical protein JO199_10345 [Candidatus Eremiobacteraeota bacterium]|nr:hypothetical protein [Candidatus Eremiobacteraeota bacterium]
MTRAIVRLALLASLLAGVVVSGRAALASAASVEDALASGLVPSAMPALLGPITSAGRKGWDCKPEHVASASHWQGAELPSPPDGR